jgi:predicted homoserine dehydrogenase-like protein
VDSLDRVDSLTEIDVVYECTGNITCGVKTALRAFAERRHLVTVSAEMDSTVGGMLARLARDAGVVYTNSDGDQPGVIARLINEVRLLGFEVVVAGNCKGFLDVHQTPEGVRPWVRPGHNERMVCAFADGSKQSLELAVLCNATGLIPDCRGMHGIRTTKETLIADALRVIQKDGVVEYTLGIDGVDAGAGVFVVARRQDARLQPDMDYLKKGRGPYYLFFRDHHLCYVEAPKTIAEAVLLHTPTLAPRSWSADVLAVAKRDLKAGDRLDGIGGSTVYGLIDTSENVRAENLLLLGLAEEAVMTQDVPRDTPISLGMVEFDGEGTVLSLRREQDRRLADGGA